MPSSRAERKMNCDEIQKKILNGERNAEIGRHLEGCPDCDDFAKFAENAMAVVREDALRTETPAHLDRAIKAYAVKNAAGRKLFIPRSFAYYRNLFTVAAAACFIISGATMLFVSLHGGKGVVSRRADRTFISGSSAVVPRWEQVGLDDDYFELSAGLIISRELMYHATEDKDSSGAFPEVDIPEREFQKESELHPSHKRNGEAEAF
jgi:hypothetical protein